MNISDEDKRTLLRWSEVNTVPIQEKRSRAKLCIYGFNGTGKTSLAVAIARKLRKPGEITLFVDSNEGWESLKNIPVLMEDIEVVPFQSIEQLWVIAEAVAAKKGKFANVGAIVLDDADFMADRDLKRLWDARVKKGTSTLDPDKPERPEYLKLGHRFGGLIDYIYENTPDVHVIMTTHDKTLKSQDGQTILRTMPGFNPALADVLEGKLLVCARMTATTRKDGNEAVYTREVQVHPTYAVDAKSRIGFDKIKYEAGDFLAEIVAWAERGGGVEPEGEAVRRDIRTRAVMTEDDTAVLNSDDAPVFFQG